MGSISSGAASGEIRVFGVLRYWGSFLYKKRVFFYTRYQIIYMLYHRISYQNESGPNVRFQVFNDRSETSENHLFL